VTVQLHITLGNRARLADTLYQELVDAIRSGQLRQGDPLPPTRQLAAQLRQRGYSVDLGAGQSHFRVDLAVGRPGDDGYRLGILVDTHVQYEQAEPLANFIKT